MQNIKNSRAPRSSTDCSQCLSLLPSLLTKLKYQSLTVVRIPSLIAGRCHFLSHHWRKNGFQPRCGIQVHPDYSSSCSCASLNVDGLTNPTPSNATRGSAESRYFKVWCHLGWTSAETALLCCAVFVLVTATLFFTRMSFLVILVPTTLYQVSRRHFAEVLEMWVV